MTYSAVLGTIVILLYLSSSSYAQGGIDHGPTGTANHDYFGVNRDPQIKHLLYLVEKHHLNSCPHNPKGVWGDIPAGRYDLAIGDLQYTLDRFVNHPKALLLMGSLTKITGNPSLGVFYYERALRLYPQYALTHAQYGRYLVDSGRIDMGIAKLKKAIELDPRLGPAHAWLAEAYAKQGSTDLARRAAEQARAVGYRGKIFERAP